MAGRILAYLVSPFSLPIVRIHTFLVTLLMVKHILFQSLMKERPYENEFARTISLMLPKENRIKSKISFLLESRVRRSVHIITGNEIFFDPTYYASVLLYST